MNPQDTAQGPARGAARPRPLRGRADKRQDILDGALSVFAQDGYTRASIEAISAAAGVSTRTIYNHFEDKAALFYAVILESTRHVADRQVAIIDKHLFKIVELEADLIAFAREWAASAIDEVEHFALVRQINAEVGHIPQDAIDAWQEAGPLRVRGALARRLREMADRGLLHITDPDRAALHLLLLVSTDRPSYYAVTPTPEEFDETVRTGVHAFLHGYLPRE